MVSASGQPEERRKSHAMEGRAGACASEDDAAARDQREPLLCGARDYGQSCADQRRNGEIHFLSRRGVVHSALARADWWRERRSPVSAERGPRNVEAFLRGADSKWVGEI